MIAATGYARWRTEAACVLAVLSNRYEPTETVMYIGIGTVILILILILLFR